MARATTSPTSAACCRKASEQSAFAADGGRVFRATYDDVAPVPTSPPELRLHARRDARRHRHHRGDRLDHARDAGQGTPLRGPHAAGVSASDDFGGLQAYQGDFNSLPITTVDPVGTPNTAGSFYV